MSSLFEKVGNITSNSLIKRNNDIQKYSETVLTLCQCKSYIAKTRIETSLPGLHARDVTARLL